MWILRYTKYIIIIILSSSELRKYKFAFRMRNLLNHPWSCSSPYAIATMVTECVQPLDMPSLPAAIKDDIQKHSVAKPVANSLIYMYNQMYGHETSKINIVKSKTVGLSENAIALQH